MSKLTINVVDVSGLSAPASADVATTKVYAVLRWKKRGDDNAFEELARSTTVAPADASVPFAEQTFPLAFQHTIAPVESDTHDIAIQIWSDDANAFPDALATASLPVVAEGAMAVDGGEWSESAAVATDNDSVKVVCRFRGEWSKPAEASAAPDAASAKDEEEKYSSDEEAAASTPRASTSPAASSRKNSESKSRPSTAGDPAASTSQRRDSDADPAASQTSAPPEKAESEPAPKPPPKRTEQRKPESRQSDSSRPARKPPVPVTSGASQRRESPSRLSAMALEPIPPEKYRLLSTVPSPPAASFTARRHEPRIRTAVEGPAPNKYHHDLAWTKGGTRIAPLTPRARPPKEQPAPPLLDTRPKWGDKAVSFGFRPTASPDRRLVDTSPGPGVYSPSGFSMAHAIDTKNRMSTAKCTFGSRRRSAKPNDVPGPASYAREVIEETPARNLPGARMSGRVKPPQPYNTPGPGEYKLRGIGDEQHGTVPMTIKGRLPHPMEAKLAEFEAAKTSCPRLPNRTMRARPRL